MYARPTSTDWITASWRDHLNRDPPSSEAGTDYGAPYGSDVVAVDDGVVTYVKTTNSTATGRVVEYRLHDGRTTRSLHLAEVRAWVGMNVRRGDLIGLSGASGFGSDWGYGAHVHQTLWPGDAWENPTIDFELYVGDEPPPPPEPPPEPEDETMTMKGAYYTRAVDGETIYLLFNEVSGMWVEHSGADPAYNNTIAQYWHTDSWAPISEAHAKVLKTSLNAVLPKPTAAGASQASTNPLVTPAWIAGFFLGLIGLVEVVRFVVDLLV